MITALAGQGYDVKRCCRILGVAPSGYFGWRSRPPSAMELRREWLRALISQIHAESRGIYGYRRVRAELRLGRQIIVSRKLVDKLMAEAPTARPSHAQAAEESDQRRDLRGSRLQRLQSQFAGPAVADRHHRAPDA